MLFRSSACGIAHRIWKESTRVRKFATCASCQVWVFAAVNLVYDSAGVCHRTIPSQLDYWSLLCDHVRSLLDICLHTGASLWLQLLAAIAAGYENKITCFTSETFNSGLPKDWNGINAPLRLWRFHQWNVLSFTWRSLWFMKATKAMQNVTGFIWKVYLIDFH